MPFLEWLNQMTQTRPQVTSAAEQGGRFGSNAAPTVSCKIVPAGGGSEEGEATKTITGSSNLGTGVKKNLTNSRKGNSSRDDSQNLMQKRNGKQHEESKSTTETRLLRSRKLGEAPPSLSNVNGSRNGNGNGVYETKVKAKPKVVVAKTSTGTRNEVPLKTRGRPSKRRGNYESTNSIASNGHEPDTLVHKRGRKDSATKRHRPVEISVKRESKRLKKQHVNINRPQSSVESRARQEVADVQIGDEVILDDVCNTPRSETLRRRSIPRALKLSNSGSILASYSVDSPTSHAPFRSRSPSPPGRHPSTPTFAKPPGTPQTPTIKVRPRPLAVDQPLVIYRSERCFHEVEDLSGAVSCNVCLEEKEIDLGKQSRHSFEYDYRLNSDGLLKPLALDSKDARAALILEDVATPKHRVASSSTPGVEKQSEKKEKKVRPISSSASKSSSREDNLSKSRSSTSFRYPSNYITYITPDWDKVVEYDADEDDEQVVKIVNSSLSLSKAGPILSLGKLERVIDAFEKRYFLLRKECSIARTLTCVPLWPKVRTAVGLFSSTGERCCCVCFRKDCDLKNRFLTCKVCDIHVHISCYGIEYSQFDNRLGDGAEFRCDACLSPAVSTQCVLCPEAGGARKESVDGRWCHVNCIIWNPEVFFRNDLTMSQVDGISNIPSYRWRTPCYLCRTSGVGSSITCAAANCPRNFHVGCAVRCGLHLEIGEVEYKAFCRTHSFTLTLEDQIRLNSSTRHRYQAKKLFHGERKPENAPLTLPEILATLHHNLTECSPKVIEVLYNYWLLKRLDWRSSLLPRLATIFRDESGGDKSKATCLTLRPTIDELIKLKRLRYDMEVSRLLVDMTWKRERLKRKRLSIISDTFQEELSQLGIHEELLGPLNDLVSPLRRSDRMRIAESMRSPRRKSEEPSFKSPRSPMLLKDVVEEKEEEEGEEEEDDDDDDEKEEVMNEEGEEAKVEEEEEGGEDGIRSKRSDEGNERPVRRTRHSNLGVGLPSPQPSLISGSRVRTCTVCNRRFQHGAGLTAHIRAKHSSDPPSTDVKTMKRIRNQEPKDARPKRIVKRQDNFESDNRSEDQETVSKKRLRRNSMSETEGADERLPTRQSKRLR